VSERAKCQTTAPINLPTRHIGVLPSNGGNVDYNCLICDVEPLFILLVHCSCQKSMYFTYLLTYLLTGYVCCYYSCLVVANRRSTLLGKTPICRVGRLIGAVVRHLARSDTFSSWAMLCSHVAPAVGTSLGRVMPCSHVPPTVS